MFGECRINLANFTIQIGQISPFKLGKFHHSNWANFTIQIGQITLAQKVGEIERQIFCQMPSTGNFSLGAQRLMKSTPCLSLFRQK